jgi:hypothetical protein
LTENLKFWSSQFLIGGSEEIFFAMPFMFAGEFAPSSNEGPAQEFQNISWQLPEPILPI